MQTSQMIAAAALRPSTYVVSQGVRHVAVDVLHWKVVTFRTICGKDVEDEGAPGDVSDCAWCRRFERLRTPS
jgi:hypothetical protein